VGTAARVEAGQKLFTLGVPLQYFNDAKEALRRAGHKLPTPIKIIVESGQELIR
jgi:large subunit ribosomal protein L10e